VKLEQQKLQKVLKYAISIIIFLGLLLAFSTLRRFRQNFLTMDISFFLLSIACTLVVYVFEGLFTRISLKVFDEDLGFFPSLKYSLIINAFGYLVSLGGLAHFATQIHVLDYHKIPSSKSTYSRIVHLIFFNIFFTILLIASFVALLANKQKGDLYITLILIVISILFLVMGGFFLAIFWKPFQDKASVLFTGFLNRLIGVFTKKFRIKSTWANDFLKDFNVGFFRLFKNPGYFASISLLTVIIWIFWLGVMYFTFLAFRYRISPGHLLTGFSIGQLIGVLSMLPGGAGTMEGSMALVFAAVGIPLETALSSIILFRLSFYIVPFFLSLPFYFSLKKNRT
jgi:uncharacterized protein (TIRG00374 family)